MMDSIIQTKQFGIAISFIDLGIGLILASLLGWFVVAVYQYTHRGLTFERSFFITLIMMAPIIAVVMMLIGSNLALSLGMVGALSIIRFRTVIKDSRDMIFLFWSIAIGLGCGTSNWLVIIMASIFISIILFILHFFKYGAEKGSDYVLVLSGLNPLPESSVKQLIKTHVKLPSLRSLDLNENDWEMVFELRRFDATTFDEGKIVADLKKIKGIKKVSLLAPQLSLPV